MATKKYSVTYTDYGDTCDGLPRLVDEEFDSREEAEEWIKEDMQDTLNYCGEDCEIVDWDKFEVFKEKERMNGCVWAIHEKNI